MLLTIGAIIGVLILAWANSAHENHLASKLTRRMDQVMGREDKDQN